MKRLASLCALAFSMTLASPAQAGGVVLCVEQFLTDIQDPSAPMGVTVRRDGKHWVHAGPDNILLYQRQAIRDFRANRSEGSLGEPNCEWSRINEPEGYYAVVGATIRGVRRVFLRSEKTQEGLRKSIELGLRASTGSMGTDSKLPDHVILDQGRY